MLQVTILPSGFGGVLLSRRTTDLEENPVCRSPEPDYPYMEPKPEFFWLMDIPVEASRQRPRTVLKALVEEFVSHDREMWKYLRWGTRYGFVLNSNLDDDCFLPPKVVRRIFLAVLQDK